MPSASGEFLAQPSRNFQPPGSIFLCKKRKNKQTNQRQTQPLKMAGFLKGTWQHNQGWRVLEQWLERNRCGNVPQFTVTWTGGFPHKECASCRHLPAGWDVLQEPSLPAPQGCGASQGLELDRPMDQWQMLCYLLSLLLIPKQEKEWGRETYRLAN